MCLVLQALFYGWGLNLSHKAAYDTLLRLRTALQKRFEKLPLGVVQDKGTGTVKKLFVDDVDSLEVLLAHSVPEGIANLMIPLRFMWQCSLRTGNWLFCLLASIPDQSDCHDDDVFCWNEENGSLLSVWTKNEQYHY